MRATFWPRGPDMKTGIAILSAMAGIWAAWGLYAAHAGRWAYFGGVIIALVPMLLMARRRFAPRSADEARRVGRLVGLATLFEAAAIIGGIQILGHVGRMDLVACLIAAAVGLHFIPLAKWMPLPKYYVCAIALVATACAGVVVPAEYRTPFVAAAASAVLWLTALSQIFATPQSDPPAD